VRQTTLTLKPCPDGCADHGLIQADDATTATLALPRGALLHVDRHRRPAADDIVLAEHLLGDRMTRSLRRFRLADGVISLARIDGRAGTLVRPRYEVGILGVVDGHIVPLDCA
jgi:hypothetical protein